MSFQWTNDNVFKLIEMYEKRELLWNTMLEEYKDRNKKHVAWTEIANAFEVEKYVVAKKMKSLIGQFQRELKKDETSSWFAFKKMMFIRNRPYKPASTRDSDVKEHLDTSFDSSTQQRRAVQIFEDPKLKSVIEPLSLRDFALCVYSFYHCIACLRPGVHPHTARTVQFKRNFLYGWNELYGSNENSHNDELSEPYHVENFHIAAPIQMHYESTDTTANLSTNSRKRTNSYDDKSDDPMGYGFAKQYRPSSKSGHDEFEIYGQYVASELRETKDLHSVLIAKRYINDILFNARIGKYRKDSASNNSKSKVIKIEQEHDSDVYDDE